MLRLQLQLCQHGRDNRGQKQRFCRHDNTHTLLPEWEELKWRMLSIGVFYTKTSQTVALFTHVKELLWEAATEYKPELKRIADNKDWQASHWVNMGRKILTKTWKSQCCHCNNWTGLCSNQLYTGARAVGAVSKWTVCTVTILGCRWMSARKYEWAFTCLSSFFTLEGGIIFVDC